MSHMSIYLSVLSYVVNIPHMDPMDYNNHYKVTAICKCYSFVMISYA